MEDRRKEKGERRKEEEGRRKKEDGRRKSPIRERRAVSGGAGPQPCQGPNADRRSPNAA
jgi:hypothetical protein